MKVLFLPEVVKQFIEIAEVLYEKGYMSFLQPALDYSESLFREIRSTLPIKVHRKAPEWFDRFGPGMYYSSFSKNRHTTWYVFYNILSVGDETVFLVRYISNNHVVAPHLELDN